MGNLVTDKIPSDVCSILMDMAQSFEHSEGIDFTYVDIMDWAQKAKRNEVENLRVKIADLADLDFMYCEDDNAIELADEIVEMIKG